MGDETTPMMISGVEQTLHRVLALFSGEMMRLASNLRADLQAIEASTDVLIDLLRDLDPQQITTDPAHFWLIRLDVAAYIAEGILDDLTYHIHHHKVHNNSFRLISFLKNVEFNFHFAHRVKWANRLLRTIYDDGKLKLRLTRTSSGGTLRFMPWLDFCLSFQKEFRVQKADLVQLWMAAGLVQSYDEGALLFENLVSGSRALEKEDDDGNFIYNIQDLVRAYPSASSYTLSHRYTYATSWFAIPMYRSDKLRSLILDGVALPKSRELKRLVILVFLNNLHIEMLPSSVGRLRHLRYLDISNTRIKTLPSFITKLYNLQTLRYLNCQELNKLPRQFNSLISLKNIAFSFEHQMPFGLGHLTCLETLSLFVVGSDRGGSIEELRFLNKLRGNLEIARLEKVRDTKEAERVNLHQKEKIDGLSFQWSYGAHGRSSSDVELLESLKPNQHVRKIKIKFYMGQNWPSWMLRTRSSSIGDSSTIYNLVSLTLERCWNCTQLPCLGDLPRLKFLTIQHMERVKCIYNGLYKEIHNVGNSPQSLFPALKSLSIIWMQNLTEWSSIGMPLDNKVVVFPRLETLTIQSCAKLTSFPMKDLSALLKIEIKDCDELRFLFHEKQSFPSLKNLSIEGCPKLTHIRNWLLSNRNFERLGIKRCEWLKFIPDDLGLQRSLVSLDINCCKGLTFFPDGILWKLTQLKKLSIGAFSENLDDFRYLNQIEAIPEIMELEIWGSDFFGRKMSSLPEQLQHLTNLESLRIMGFTTMEALPEWISHFQSLQNLSLNYCRLLEHQSTATMIQRLPRLEKLYTYGCHTLERNKLQWNGLPRITITNTRDPFSI